MIVTIWPFQSSKRMSVYTVHEPPEPPVDRIDRAEAMVFIKDGFNWSAFLFGPLWLLANGLWQGFLLYGAVLALLIAGINALGIDPGWVGLAIVGLNAIVGYEAHALYEWVLGTRGWSQAGSVMGATEAECERRFFEGWLPTQAPLREHTRAAGQSASAQAIASDVGAVKASRRGLFGMFRRAG
ncbi:MAG: DUF2628 domain-containing protein [Hyphomicrobiaceae bacterium]